MKFWIAIVVNFPPPMGLAFLHNQHLRLHFAATMCNILQPILFSTEVEIAVFLQQNSRFLELWGLLPHP